MAKAVEVDSEVVRCEEALRAALSEHAEALRRAADPGEQVSPGVWRRLPMSEPDASKLRSDASHRVAQARAALEQARRPKLSVPDATARLAAAETALDEAKTALGQVSEDAASSDPEAQLRALDADRDSAARSLRRATIIVDAAKATLRDAEERERSKRAPLFEIRARAVAKKLHEKLDALAEIVAEAVELGEQARAAGVSFDPPIFPGLLPERVNHWRAQQTAAGRLDPSPLSGQGRSPVEGR